MIHQAQANPVESELRSRMREHKRIVVKVGTTTLTHEHGKLNLKRISQLSWVLTDLHNQGKEIVLVTSGAIAVGMDRLAMNERPREMMKQQAASAVGQAALMQIYENFFSEYNQKVAQILLTKDVFEEPIRKQNAKNTFISLLNMGVVPIVNENDTVSTDEIGFSDNDALSAYVACLIEADLLIILSDINGIYDSDPKLNPDAKIISLITKIDAKLKAMAGGSVNGLGTGGMATKITAAQMASANGIETVIAQGENPLILFNILNGETAGTFISTRLKRL